MSADDDATDDQHDAPAGTPLATALAEVDRHLAAGGWDQPARLYALVKTAELVYSEPALAEALGLATDVPPESLTPVEQESLPAGQPLDEWLAGIGWPPEVFGCALAQEVLALPPSVEADVPDDGSTDPVQWAATHPLRREVRMLVGVLRDGSRTSILRVRGQNDADDDIVTGEELVPLLADALAATLTD
jgi:hypothetical protein